MPSCMSVLFISNSAANARERGRQAAVDMSGPRVPSSLRLKSPQQWYDSHLFSLALLPKHNMEDEGKRNMCPAHLSCRVFQIGCVGTSW